MTLKIWNRIFIVLEVLIVAICIINIVRDIRAVNMTSMPIHSSTIINIGFGVLYMLLAGLAYLRGKKLLHLH